MDAISDLLDAAKARNAFSADRCLAGQLGVTRAAISRWRSGSAVPSDRLAPRLALLSGLSMVEVLRCFRAARLVAKQAATQSMLEAWRPSGTRYRSWLELDPLTRLAAASIRRSRRDCTVTLDQTMNQLARSVIYLLWQTAGAGREPVILAQSDWALGYGKGVLEAGVRNPVLNDDDQVMPFVELGLRKILRAGKTVERLMSRMEELHGREQFVSGALQGTHDRVNMDAEARPAALRTYLLDGSALGASALRVSNARLHSDESMVPS